MERFLCRKPSTTAVDRPPWFQNRLNISARVGLWDTALKFLSPGPRNDVTDHLVPCFLEMITFHRSPKPVGGHRNSWANQFGRIYYSDGIIMQKESEQNRVKKDWLPKASAIYSYTKNFNNSQNLRESPTIRKPNSFVGYYKHGVYRYPAAGKEAGRVFRILHMHTRQSGIIPEPPQKNSFNPS